MLLIDPNLHLLPWARETGSDINKIPATTYTAVNVSGAGPSGRALLVTNTSNQAGGADLVTCKRLNYCALYPALKLNYVRLRCRMFISSADMVKLGRLETDMKACMIVCPPTPPGQAKIEIVNVPNASTQVNLSDKHWQIDGNPPGWKDTAFQPTLPADQWFDYYHDLLINPVAKTFTVLGVGFGKQTYKTAAPDPQNVPWQTTDWAELVLAIQLQIMILTVGTVSVMYDLMDAVWSDSPIQ